MGRNNHFSGYHNHEDSAFVFGQFFYRQLFLPGEYVDKISC